MRNLHDDDSGGRLLRRFGGAPSVYRGTGSTGATGSQIVNVEPTPISLSTVMSPPMRRANWRLMESPSPVPRS